MFKITFEGPKIGEEVKKLLGEHVGRKKEKKEKPKPWTYKERLLVGIVLGATIILSLIFWYSSGNSISWPSIDFGGFGLNQTVVIEK